MTIAAARLHQDLTVKFPGIRLSRFACRNTAGGSISQHSSYGRSASDPIAFHSNAIDVFPPLGMSFDEGTEFLDGVHTYVKQFEEEFSIRLTLWKVRLHFDHIHYDFWPTCLEEKWCARRITPDWQYSNGDIVTTNDPIPEYDLEEEMSFANFVEGWADGLALDPINTWNRLCRLFDETELMVDVEATPMSDLPTEASAGSETRYWWQIIMDPMHPDRSTLTQFYAARELEFWAQSAEEAASEEQSTEA